MRVPVVVSGVHCRAESKLTTWDLTGREQTDSLHVSMTYRCRSCGRVRLQYGDGKTGVTDAEAMCLAVLEEWERRNGRDGRHDRDDMLGHLSAELWRLYLAWDGRGTFRGYGFSFLRKRFNDYFAKLLGSPDAPKPLSVADSYDADPGGRGLERALGRGAVDDREHRDSDLRRVLASRRGGIAEQDRKLGPDAPENAPSRAASGDDQRAA